MYYIFASVFTPHYLSLHRATEFTPWLTGRLYRCSGKLRLDTFLPPRLTAFEIRTSDLLVQIVFSNH